MSDSIRRALADIQPLAAEDIDRIAGMGLVPPDAAVLGWWRAACHLLDRDSLFTVMLRDEAWARWESQAGQALEEALLYRDNEELLLALAVINALLPGVYEHATLRGFKGVVTVLATCQRYGSSVKRQRRISLRRIEDRVAHRPILVGADGTLRDEVLADADRQRLLDAGWQERWCASFQHVHAAEVVRFVGAVLDVTWQMQGGDTVVVVTAGPRDE